MNRFLFFRGETTKSIPVPKPPNERRMQAVEKTVKRAIESFPGAIGLDRKARRLWDSFYKRHWANRPTEELPAQMTSRIDVHARRIAALYAALEQTGDVTVGQMQAAIDVALYCQEVALGLATEIGVSRDAAIEKRILRILKTAPNQQTTRRKLHQKLGGRVSGEKLTKLIHGLREVNRITYQSNGPISFVP
jgi:hypothetical protein